MVITVLSCSKNEETFYPFYYCMEKFWPKHPEIIYFTDRIINPFYKTIAIPGKLELWTKAFRDFLCQIEEDQVLLMIDDCFIRQPVNTKRIQYASKCLKDNIAMFNFEKSYDPSDEKSEFDGFNKKKHGAEFEVSLMCGLWQREKLLKVVERDCSPWDIELNQDGCGFDYYINSGDYIIDWGYKTFQPCGLVKGKWARECKEFFDKEGIEIDYSKKGFVGE